MVKYNLLPEQLIYEGTVGEENFFRPAPLHQSHILQVHEPGYWNQLITLSLSKSDIRRTGFPLSRPLIDREITIMQGTLQSALFALQYGVAFNIAGGTHHAFTNRGEGFCLLNDIAIAAQYLLDNKLAKKILVVDLDVHQGNGTAQIFAHNPHVFTFSIHGAKNFPMHKASSDLDIGLPDGTEDGFYLRALQENLSLVMEQFEPDFIFFQSGVDVLATDKLGRLNLSIKGCKTRDQLVLEKCKAHQIPVAASMGGGYAEKISDVVEAHANTYRLAQNIFF